MGREDLIRAVEEHYAAGVMSMAEIARHLGVSHSFVRYHAWEKGHRWRAARQVFVTMTCAGCGDPRRITKDSLARRKQRGLHAYRCRRCQRGFGMVSVPAGTANWLLPDERERPKAWARRVLASWTVRERAEFLGAIESLLSVKDDSRFARPRRPA